MTIKLIFCLVAALGLSACGGMNLTEPKVSDAKTPTTMSTR